MKVTSKHEVQKFGDGETIFTEGDSSQEMFVVRSGKVEISKNVGGNALRLATLDRGAFFGEMSLLEGLPRSATARAVGDVSLLVLRPATLLLQIRRDPTFAFELLQQLSGRIRDLDEKLVFKLAVAEFGNRLARSAFTIGAGTEYLSAGATPDVPVRVAP
jgi:CRP/FNR family transcriptional regulator, cyclic AMP receptor protein